MKRKVSQIGPTTLMVSLPSKWVKRHCVKKGDELEIIEDGNGLNIRTSGTAENLIAKIDITGCEPMIKRALGALYKAGYSEMNVEFSTAKEFATAQEVIREEFIGFEITKHGKSFLVAKEVTAPKAEEFDSILKRMIFVIGQMGHDAADAMRRNDRSQLQAIALRDKDVNKLADFCRRILNQIALDRRNPPMYFIVEQLERIGDHYRELCKVESRLSAEMDSLLAETNGFYSMFVRLSQDFSLKQMAQFGRKREELRKMYKKMRPKPTEMPFMIIAVPLIESIFDLNGALMASRL